MWKRLAGMVIAASVTLGAVPVGASEITKDDCAKLRAGFAASLNKVIKLTDRFEDAARTVQAHMVTLSRHRDTSEEMARIAGDFSKLAAKLQSVDVDMAAENEAVSTIRRLCG